MLVRSAIVVSRPSTLAFRTMEAHFFVRRRRRESLKHLPGFKPNSWQPRGALDREDVLELGVASHFAARVRTLTAIRGIALLRDEFRSVVWRQLIHEEEVARCEDVPQQLDPFTNERRNREHFFLRDLESGSRTMGRRRALNSSIGVPNVLGIQPDGFGIERLLRRRRRFLEVHDRVGAVNAFQRECGDQLLPRQFFAIVFRRPSQRQGN